MRKIQIFLLVFCLLLTGCGVQAGKGPDDSCRFVDDLGRSVAVKESRRVAALLGSFADVWVLAGGSLCAAAEDAWEDFGLELPDAVNIGGAHSPNLELLLAAGPDLVLASASTASHREMEETLENAGIAVAYFDVDNFSDYLRMLRVCTQLTGREDLYQANGLALQARIDGVKAAFTAENWPEERKTVLLLRASASSVKAKGSSGTILGEMLADLGLVNIADSDKTLLENLSVEAVIRRQPCHIFVVTMGSDTQAAQRAVEAMLRENPAWATLDAVQSGRIYTMDKTLFNLKPNDRWAEAYEILYETLQKQKN